MSQIRMTATRMQRIAMFPIRTRLRLRLTSMPPRLTQNRLTLNRLTRNQPMPNRDITRRRMNRPAPIITD